MNITRYLVTLVTLIFAYALPAVAQVSYTDILLSPENYVGKDVTMHGEFYIMNTERQSFNIMQGDNKIEVFYKQLPKEAQATILSQKNFSNVPVVVKGKLQRYAKTKSSYYIMATDVQGLAQKEKSGDGLLYTDILLSPENYVGKDVTMHGEFYIMNTERQSFNIMQGDNKIEVFYKQLPKEAQATILSQKNFSNVPVVVKGKLQRYAKTKSSYYIMATDVQGLAQKEKSGDGLLYTDILLSPENYVGKDVTMHGEFYIMNTERQSFNIMQGDNKIEVFYKQLPKEAQATILSQKNFSNVPVVVKGKLQRYAKTKSSYYIMATDVLWR